MEEQQPERIEFEYVPDSNPTNERMMRIRELLGALIADSEELARILAEMTYTYQVPLNTHFEKFLHIFIVQLKQFQNEVEQ